MYKIKQLPEDFIVKESTNIALQDKGVYSCFILKKRNYTTMDAVKRIAEALQIPIKNIGFAGSKDKRAVTEQWISIKNCNAKHLKLKDVELIYLGKTGKPISLGDLAENRFEIAVRNIIGLPKKLTFFVNYFGEQRFSKNNIEIGRLIIKKRFKDAVNLMISNESNNNYKEHLEKCPHDFIGLLRAIPKKILQLYIHSYQSYIWNETVRQYLKNNQGSLNGKIIPIIGFGTEFKDDIVKSIVGRILKEEGISLRDFIIKEIPELSSEGTERNIFASIKGLKTSKLEKDELNKGSYKIKIAFRLDKGCYATEAIKALFKDS